MNKTEFIAKTRRTLCIAGLKLKKRSPEILIFSGVIGVVTGAVMACHATTKLNPILDDSKEAIDRIHKFADDDKDSENDAKKELAIVYAQTGLKVAKLYAPSVIVGALSITGILSAHNIISKRNTALAAAYAAVDKSLKEYRKRVSEQVGDETERELFYNIKTERLEKTAVDEAGNEETVIKEIKTADKQSFGVYTRIFDESNPYWEKVYDYNAHFLKTEQAHANDLLVANGFVFLNDVLKRLGFEPTKIGQLVGWYYDPSDPKKHNYIDFGMYDVTDQAKCNFINGDERSVILDFNVDGNILDLI